jgi:single-strand DNA-binding protein
MTQVITISGNVGKDAELRTVRDSQVLGFNVGVKNGFGRDAGSVWYRCSLWGKAAEVFADSIKKGTKVFITGDLTHDEYEGKPQYNVRVNSIDTGPRVEGAGGGTSAPPTGSSWDDTDLDDSVPFITSNPAFEHRVF